MAERPDRRHASPGASAHPTRAAAWLLVGVTVLIVLLAVLSTI